MLIFNGFMFAVNGGGFWVGVVATRFTRDLWACRAIDPSSTDFRENVTLHLGYFYLWSRLLDMVDTVFFVLRKKTNHVSFLHVFHHAVVPLIAYIGLKLHPGGNAGYLPLTNVFIHGFMYAYYGMACVGTLSKHVWWKKVRSNETIQKLTLFVI